MAGRAGGASARQRLHVWPLAITPSVRGEEPFGSQMSHTEHSHVKKRKEKRSISSHILSATERIRVNSARLSLMSFKAGCISWMSDSLLTEWVYVQQTEKCVCTAYVYSPLYLERSAQIVLKMALKLQMVHNGQEEPSFS